MARITTTLVATVLLVVAASVPTLAQETSGQVIKELVDAVDTEMSSLEERVDNFSARKSTLTNELKGKYDTLKKTKDKMERESFLTDMLVICAELNAQDLEEVSAYQATIGSLVPKLTQLREEVQSAANMGFKHEKEFREYRARMGQFLQNSANIVETLRKTSPTDVDEELLPIENTLVGLYRVLNSPLRPSEASTAQITETIRALEENFAQLKCVAGLLEQERLRIDWLVIEIMCHRALLGPSRRMWKISTYQPSTSPQLRKKKRRQS